MTLSSIYVAELNANKHQDLLIDMMGKLVKLFRRQSYCWSVEGITSKFTRNRSSKPNLETTSICWVTAKMWRN